MYGSSIHTTYFISHKELYIILGKTSVDSLWSTSTPIRENWILWAHHFHLAQIRLRLMRVYAIMLHGIACKHACLPILYMLNSCEQKIFYKYIFKDIEERNTAELADEPEKMGENPYMSSMINGIYIIILKRFTYEHMQSTSIPIIHKNIVKYCQ